MPDKFIPKKKADPDPYEFDHLSASSATECTGLIPAAPESAEELESYNEIYPFLPEAQSKKEKEKA